MPIDDQERARRKALLAAHYDAENAHDLDRILETFSATGEMLYNGRAFRDPEAIRWAHGYMGFSSEGGAFRDLRAVRDHEHLTDDEIVVEGRICATHTGEFLGNAATGRAVELPFVAFYRFGADGKLESERVVMNLAALKG